MIVMDDCITEERFQLMSALGAEIDVVASVEGRPKVTAQDIHNMVARAEELAKRPGHTRTGSELTCFSSSCQSRCGVKRGGYVVIVLLTKSSETRSGAQSAHRR